MMQQQTGNPLHGVTLKMILDELVKSYGWEGLGRRIAIRCFNHEPSIDSSLKFLRRTAWAREQVELLYIDLLRRKMGARRVLRPRQPSELMKDAGRASARRNPDGKPHDRK